MAKFSELTARELVRNRLERLNNIETNKPGSVKGTAMLFAFIEALNN